MHAVISHRWRMICKKGKLINERYETFLCKTLLSFLGKLELSSLSITEPLSRYATDNHSHRNSLVIYQCQDTKENRKVSEFRDSIFKFYFCFNFSRIATNWQLSRWLQLKSLWQSMISGSETVEIRLRSKKMRAKMTQNKTKAINTRNYDEVYGSPLIFG